MKTAARALIDRVGGYDPAEIVAHRGRAQLHAYQDLRNPSFMPADVLLHMERALVEMGGEAILVPLLARRLGLLCVPLPAGEGELAAETAALLRSAGELAARHVEAMADGSLGDAERAELAEAAQTIHAIAARLLALLAGPALPVGRG